MSNVTSGGGWAAVWYTVQKSFEARGGPIGFWKRMASNNSCKTCAYGMGGQLGGMRNELGHFPEFCKKSVFGFFLNEYVDFMLKTVISAKLRGFQF